MDKRITTIYPVSRSEFLAPCLDPDAVSRPDRSKQASTDNNISSPATSHANAWPNQWFATLDVCRELLPELLCRLNISDVFSFSHKKL